MAHRFCPICRSRPHLHGCPMKRKRRHNPAMAVGGFGGATFNPRRHHRNPGGTNWLLIGGLAVGAFMLMRGGGIGGLLPNTSVTPYGYTYLGSGYYRGPNGQVYLRNSSGQLAPASNQQAAEAQLTTLGIQTATGVAGAAVGGLGLLLKGAINSLFTNTGGGPTAVSPSLSDPTVTGTAPSDPTTMTQLQTPQPEAPGVGALPPMDSAQAAYEAGIADPLAVPQGP